MIYLVILVLFADDMSAFIMTYDFNELQTRLAFALTDMSD
jgi:hypothetical protein